MIILVKLIVQISLTLLAESTDSHEPIKEYAFISKHSYKSYTIDTSKEKAFQILENKCNVCHSKRNKRPVFTLDNMDPWEDDVYKQVFIKKRMPKGKKIKLATFEYQELLTWITSTKKI
ncbi:hypothetical protein [Spongiivirga citrea]|uniref:Uncharacterized protein n=1 Tax=Spongiivirga citrea TaxID=1481457 RepID=A0A6M0CP07_9FLAO|nr:hypothetical protein [Spongiivirga citrea]NER17794.1 hypothetical protein [Spongiivirga citrea]